MTPVQIAKLNIENLTKLELDLCKFRNECSTSLKDNRKIQETIMLVQQERSFSIDVVLKYGDNK